MRVLNIQRFLAKKNHPAVRVINNKNYCPTINEMNLSYAGVNYWNQSTAQL